MYHYIFSSSNPFIKNMQKLHSKLNIFNYEIFRRWVEMASGQRLHRAGGSWFLPHAWRECLWAMKSC